MAKSKTIKVKLVRGLAGKSELQKKTVYTLGLRKINEVREHQDNPVIRGVIRKVSHMVQIIEN